ncbi:MAG: ubiquinol-cytochrome c reductase iron-sulfur subunit [Thermoguttaceae bacterium]
MNEMTSRGGARGNRREFVSKTFVCLGAGSLATSVASTVYANFRFFFPKVLYEPPAQFKAGFPTDYQANSVSDRWAEGHQVWIVREDRTLYALLRVCTHLECLVGYFPGEALFKCPCHGSNFSLQGDPVAGPAPVPLFRLALSLGMDGQIVVDKSVRENRPGQRDEEPFVMRV